MDLRRLVTNPNYQPLDISPRLLTELEGAPLDTLCAVLGVSPRGARGRGQRAAGPVRDEILSVLLGPAGGGTTNTNTWARQYLCAKLRENGFRPD